jgi:hypothetical protein
MHNTDIRHDINRCTIARDIPRIIFPDMLSLPRKFGKYSNAMGQCKRSKVQHKDSCCVRGNTVLLDFFLDSLWKRPGTGTKTSC